MAGKKEGTSPGTASRAKELKSQPALDLDQEILQTTPAPNPPEVEENAHDISNSNASVIPQLDGPAETTNDMMKDFGTE